MSNVRDLPTDPARSQTAASLTPDLEHEIRRVVSESLRDTLQAPWLRKWLLDKVRSWGGGVALLVSGAGVGVAPSMINRATTDPVEDAAEERPAAASGPLPEQAARASAIPSDVETLEACSQCRDDALLAIETCSAQARACGDAAPPLPKPTPALYERTYPNRDQEQNP